jgi:hypothetical protein
MQRTALLLCLAVAIPGLGYGKTAKMFESVEWTFTNPSFEGNPYDLVAKATFTHPTAEKIVTELFYNGGNKWKLRFTGTATGEWSFQTTSSDPELTGLTGRVTVTPNPGMPGFITKLGDGSRWGRTGTNRAYVPQLVMFPTPDFVHQNTGLIGERLEVFFGDHGFNGFHVPVLCRWFNIHEPTCANLGSNPNPDRRTFRALEKVIRETRAAGGVVHIWVWGDEPRGQTPHRWGINGVVDRRLQRYIAARLGPLPGWSMGYGFDLPEWVTRSQLEAWRRFMQNRLGWFHFLGGRTDGPRSGTDHSTYVDWNRPLDYSSYQHHQPNYGVYVSAIKAVPGQPVMSEDRFRVRNEGRGKDYTLTQTRRGWW